MDGSVAGVSCLGQSNMTTEATTEPTIWTETTIGTEPTKITTTSEPPACPHGWLDADHMGCFFLQENLTVNSWCFFCNLQFQIFLWSSGTKLKRSLNLICEDLGGFLMEPKTEEIQVMTSTLDNFFLGFDLLLIADAAWHIWWGGLVDWPDGHRPWGILAVGGWGKYLYLH